ncbi:MAG: hypothetical protein OEV66_09830, partial [Spirochaetia bacterium]|nr:hypothetical protein [Spirochaetia bacterium]
MSQIRILKSNSASKCSICHGEGFIYRPSGGLKSMDYLEICQCIEETCVCDKKAPYKYLDEEHRKLVDCRCKETRV